MGVEDRLTGDYGELVLQVGNVMNAMKSMTRRRDDPLYVGEYKQISGSMKTFYKCPPELIKEQALTKYNLTREAYTSLYYKVSTQLGANREHCSVLI